MSGGPHVSNTVAYSVTKSPFVCHGKFDKSQEDFDCCCYEPGNAFFV